MELRLEELEKARRNLEQIYLYFLSAMSTAPADIASVEAIEQVGSTARLIQTNLREMAAANGIGIEATPLPSDLPGQARLEQKKLQAISAYMNKVLRWLGTAKSSQVPATCREAFLQVSTVVEALAQIVEDQAAMAQEVEQAAPGSNDPLASVDTAPSGPAPVEVPDMGSLVLEHTFQEPLLRGVEGKYELTQRAIEQIDTFFAGADIAHDTGERRRYYRKIARWLEATPDGMVLAIRIGGLSGRPEPYPKYQQRPKSKTG